MYALVNHGITATLKHSASPTVFHSAVHPRETHVSEEEYVFICRLAYRFAEKTFGTVSFEALNAEYQFSAAESADGGFPEALTNVCWAEAIIRVPWTMVVHSSGPVIPTNNRVHKRAPCVWTRDTRVCHQLLVFHASSAKL